MESYQDLLPVTQGMPTEKISKESWCSIRDILADLWDWWGEGVHLRPQPETDDYGHPQFNKPAYVHELIKYHMPKDISSAKAVVPPRSITMDAFLGEGLFLLCAAVHGFIITVELEAAKMSDMAIFEADEADKVDKTDKDTEVVPIKRYQDKVMKDGRAFFCFRPGGENQDYFSWYCHRINASGWRPVPDFPAGHVCPFINLQNKNLLNCDFFIAYLRGADLRGAYLGGANLRGANLRGAYLRGANLVGANLVGADLVGADLVGADLIGAHLVEVNLRGADLAGVRMNQVQVDELVKEKWITEEQRQQIKIIKRQDII